MRKQIHGKTTPGELVLTDAPVRKWKISRHVNVTGLQDNDADRILADGMRVLASTGSGADDVSCPLTITRDGSVGTFSTTNGIIYTTADWLAVCQTGGRVHVVNQINICGGTAFEGIIGCSSYNGDCMVVARQYQFPELEGVLWMHEYGHNQGNDDDYARGKAIMYYQLGEDHRAKNQDECNHYQQPEQLAGRQPGHQESPPQIAPPAVRDFVHRRFVHGISLNQARRFSSRDVPTLVEMLNDANEERFWPNIVATLCLIGDPQAVKPLIAFFERDTGALSPSHFDAKTAVIIHFGHLIKSAGKLQCLDAFNMLAAGLTLEFWNDRAQWTNRTNAYGLAKREQNKHLASVAAWGLANSGDIQAFDLLRGMQLRGQSANTVSLSPALLNETIEFMIKQGLPGPAVRPALPPSSDSIATVTTSVEHVIDKIATTLARLSGSDALFPHGIDLIDVEVGSQSGQHSMKVHVRGSEVSSEPRKSG